MIGKGKSISHGVAALEYDLAKEIDGQAAATEIARHGVYGCGNGAGDETLLH